MIQSQFKLDGVFGRHNSLQCAFGRAFAVSIRTGGGYLLSSAALRIRNSEKIEVIQHSGHRNSPPDPRAQKALSEYIMLAQSDLKVLKRFESDRVARANEYGGDAAETAETYQIYFAPAREWVFKAYYAPLLPRSESSMGRNEWLELKGLRSLARIWADDLCG